MAGRRHGKRYRAELEQVPSEGVSIADAIKALKGFGKVKFDQTVELVVWLGIDPRQADQAIRGSMSLPHGIGKSKRVIAFCEGEQAEAATAAGAVEVGSDELVAKIQKGWMDFDVAVAVPSMMRNVSKLGRVLGPQGKMPSPKSGTVTDDVAQAVKDYSAGKVEFRNDAGGNLHLPVGKLSFDEQKLVDNVEAFMARVRALKPSSVKGTYLKKAVLTATMSPSVHLDVA